MRRPASPDIIDARTTDEWALAAASMPPRSVLSQDIDNIHFFINNSTIALANEANIKRDGRLKK